jgi:hypothetical protein
MEVISNENQFGKDGSRTFQNLEKALHYFNELSKKLGFGRCFEDLSHLDRQADISTTEGKKAPPSEKSPVIQTNKTDVVRLNDTLNKNGLVYKLIERTNKVGLYETYVYKKLCGFEVAIIRVLPSFVNIAGNHYQVREALPSNDEFGIEGSKCFFASEPKRAIQYFKTLSDEITVLENGGNNHFYTNKYSKE